MSEEGKILGHTIPASNSARGSDLGRLHILTVLLLVPFQSALVPVWCVVPANEGIVSVASGWLPIGSQPAG